MKRLVRQAVSRIAEVGLRRGASFRTRGLVRELQELACLRDLLGRLRINCVIDVGASGGNFAGRLRKTGYAGHIVSFEPVEETFRYLQNVAAGDTLWRQYNFALGSEDTRRPLNVTSMEDGFTGFTSFLDLKNVDVLLDPDALKTETREMIGIRRLDGFLDEILEPVADPRVFLKIDTQGFDVEVMKGAAGCMERILGLQSEVSVVPIYDGMPHYTEALSYYESCGFSLMNLFIVSTARQRNILEYDCHMVRLDALDS